ncbi:hypothetical protein BGW38_010172 [Lunasporangiospora selenospora]|uniref:Uncharacterized protein n=1 Tax=Lunasporangiospora selenospora TaxID=979761 RepID=A0A9P6G3Q9_9FUNG|nr:hypothetical protein BGW38_010172 [Lunasporangiospora selenospora]
MTVDYDQEMMMSTADQELNTDKDEEMLIQGPAITRLCPEILSLIFYYVYVTPVVHRPTSSADHENKSENEGMQGAVSSGEQDQGHSSSSSTTTSTASTSSDTSSATSGVTARPKKDGLKSVVYIQNDLRSMLSLCLTCRAFYPQAVRILWRQRTLATNGDLTEFYQAIDLSRSSTLRRLQKQKYQPSTRKQMPSPYELGGALDIDGHRQDSEWAMGNEAALRIKSLTLLDMPLLESTLPLNSSSASSVGLAAAESVSALTGQFFGSSSSSSGLESLSSAGAGLEESMIMMSEYGKDSSAQAPLSHPPSPSSSAVASSSSTITVGTSRKRIRRKTSSIYSEMLSPRLLHTLADFCFALEDLTICLDIKNSSFGNASFNFPKTQPTVPLSILAGKLPSLKRLTLAGLVCDPKRNKTGSELLTFAKSIQPLEKLSIRSCVGIGQEILISFAIQSKQTLATLELQGIDLSTGEALAKVVGAYASHCKSLGSITLSCLEALPLDEMVETLAYHRPSYLRELHVLGHDTFRSAAQGPGQVEGQVPAPHQMIQNAQGQPVGPGEGVTIPFTQLCRINDATAVMFGLSQLSLRRLTLYCPGITDYALVQYLNRSPQLMDLVLNEPTTVMHHPQFYHFVQQQLQQQQPAELASLSVEQQEQGLSEIVPDPFTSAGFLGIIRNGFPTLKYLFIKLSLETAQEWIVQPCFQEAGLNKCLYQYRTTSGAPAVVLMCDARNSTPLNST